MADLIEVFLLLGFVAQDRRQFEIAGELAPQAGFIRLRFAEEGGDLRIEAQFSQVDAAFMRDGRRLVATEKTSILKAGAPKGFCRGEQGFIQCAVVRGDQQDSFVGFDQLRHDGTQSRAPRLAIRFPDRCEDGSQNGGTECRLGRRMVGCHPGDQAIRRAEIVAGGMM